MTTTTIAKFAHLQIPLEDVLKATDNFHFHKIIRHGGLGLTYRGVLLHSGNWIEIAAERLDSKHGQGDDEFWTEHPNIVSIVGFCDEEDEKIIVTRYAANESLQELLDFNPGLLTWSQRLKICVGVARALSYLYYDKSRDYSVIHGNIKSSTILLDENLKPKLSGFKVPIKQSANRVEQVIHSKPVGTTGYMDPEIEKNKGVTHKSDIFSFGVVLFEILCGMLAFNSHDGNRLLARWAIDHYENGKLHDIIHPYIRNQMSQLSLVVYSKTAYSCLKQMQTERPPHIIDIVDELERALTLQLRHENRVNNLEHLEFLRIPMRYIILATNNFSMRYKTADRRDYTLYKAELDYFDKENLLSVEGKNKRERQKKTVFITRYLYGGEERLVTKIEMLTSVRHPNIVTPLGFCVECSEVILVTDINLSNRYLARYLENHMSMHILTWEKRLKICIDVAHTLNYLHSEVEHQMMMIMYPEINSRNIVLDENWVAKIIDLEHSIALAQDQEDNHYFNRIGKPSYKDPEYTKTHKLNKESHIYSFGVVLFEILCGRLAYDPIYLEESDKGLAHVTRQSFCNGTIEDMVDPTINKEIRENNFVINKGPNKDSLHTFIKIAYQCLSEAQDQRPTMKVVVKELQKALFFQNMESIPTKFASLQIPLEDVVKATNDFHHDNIIRHSGFCTTYKGRLLLSGRLMKIVAQRFDCMQEEGELKFMTVISVLSKLKHKNLVSIIGICYEKDEKIIITTYEANGSLSQYLSDPNLTWTQRLKICLGVARALSYLRYDEGRDYAIIHCNINSDIILLDKNWEAKLSGFEISIKQLAYHDHQVCLCEHIGTVGCTDPAIENTGSVTHKSDIYSFGVVLFEILCGRKAFIENEANRFLAPLAKYHYENGTLQDIIHPNLWNNQISSLSLDKYSKVAYSCLEEERAHRPEAKNIVGELMKALQSHLRPENLAYNQFAHLEIQLEEIVSATNNFAPENLIAEGGFGKAYKGQLRRSGQLIDIYARRLDDEYGQGDNQFWTEISMLSSLQHENIITLFGFSDEDDEKIIIYEHAIHGSLDQHLSDPNLTWFQRLKICLGVARGLSYIHYDVIHCDIDSSKIVLDKDWEPKIFGFEHSTKYPQSWRHRLLFSHNFYNPNMTPKYDVYCFGVLLFEILYGKKPMKTEDGVKVELDDIINPKLRKQMDRQSLGDFKKIVYNCLSEYPVQRPTMDDIVKKLEDVWELQCQHENIEHSPSTDEGTSSNLLKVDEMDEDSTK
uniref:Putative receptor-like tyrosine-protein kinase kin-15 n=1 Tax=Helianthus annuus TaxID=4232 RepID=A0A251TEE7_HELAN